MPRRWPGFKVLDFNERFGHAKLGNTKASHFYFTIGSVDSFERNLDLTQMELGIPSRERIPVKYSQEVDKLNLFLNFAPILVLLGFLYMASGGAKGMRPGSGPGGIFNVGKSKGC